MQSFSQVSVVNESSAKNTVKNQSSNDYSKRDTTDKDAFSKVLNRADEEQQRQVQQEKNDRATRTQKEDRKDVTDSPKDDQNVNTTQAEVDVKDDAKQIDTHQTETGVEALADSNTKNVEAEILAVSSDETLLNDETAIPVAQSVEVVIENQNKTIDEQFNAIKSGMLPLSLPVQSVKEVAVPQTIMVNLAPSALGITGALSELNTFMKGTLTSKSLNAAPTAASIAPTMMGVGALQPNMLMQDLQLTPGPISNQLSLQPMQLAMAEQGLMQAGTSIGELTANVPDENLQTNAKIETTTSLQAMEQLKSLQKSLDLATTAPISRTPAPQIGQDAWVDPMQQKINWMMNKNIQQATLQLDPAEMGHIEVKIQLTADGLNVQFNAQHPQVKEALESQSLRLREMIEAQVSQDVSLDFRQDQSSSSGQSETSEHNQGDAKHNENITEASDITESVSRIDDMSLIDLHA